MWGGPPGPAFLPSAPTWASAADLGVRPTGCDIIFKPAMRLLIRCAFASALLFKLLAAQQPTPAPAPNEPPKELSDKEKEDLDAGIPITNELVRKTCSPCHKPDDKQRLSRISWRRTTPEG